MATQLSLLTQALAFIPEGQAIGLGGDAFLTGALDGADKVRGFARQDGELLVLTNGTPHPLDELGRQDLRYLFGAFAGIYQKITARLYEVQEIAYV